MSDARVFMIGTSAGGVTALHGLLAVLSPDFRRPLIIVQHLPDMNHVDVASIYKSPGDRRIVEIEDKMPIEENHVYFAPGGYHVMVDGDRCFSLSQDEPLRFSRPSIDLSFESAAEVFRENLVGIVLTGANDDGAQGLRAIQNAGGIAVVQDPEEAEYADMPRAAMTAVKPEAVTRLAGLPDLLLRLQSGEAR